MNGFGILTTITLAALTPSGLFHQENTCDIAVPMNLPGINLAAIPDGRFLSEEGERACSVKLTYLLSDGTTNVPVAEIYTIIPSRVAVTAKLSGIEGMWGCRDGALVEIGKEAKK